MLLSNSSPASAFSPCPPQSPWQGQHSKSRPCWGRTNESKYGGLGVGAGASFHFVFFWEKKMNSKILSNFIEEK